MNMKILFKKIIIDRSRLIHSGMTGSLIILEYGGLKYEQKY